MDTFTVGGHGGSGKDTSNSGVRVTHLASKAVGRAVDTRSMEKNRRSAFERMAHTKKFQDWIKLEASRRMGDAQVIEERVDQMMAPHNLRVEEKDDRGRWQSWEPNSATKTST